VPVKQDGEAISYSPPATFLKCASLKLGPRQGRRAGARAALPELSPNAYGLLADPSDLKASFE